MGTSSSYGGPSGNTPLVPTWLEEDEESVPGDGVPLTPDGVPAAPPERPVPPPAPDRFRTTRSNFSRFVRSGGSDRASLGRAISGYVSTASGGARQATRRMGTSRRAGARLLGFLADVQARGAREALRALNMEALAGRPIDEIFLGLADYVCPDGGDVDQGIARDAFIETIADLAELGIADLDALTTEQVQTAFELYASHAIEARLCNDVGTKIMMQPQDVRTATRVQAQLRDFVRRGVSDALTVARAALQALTPGRVLSFVEGVYESAFSILQAMGEAAGARARGRA